MYAEAETGKEKRVMKDEKHRQFLHSVHSVCWRPELTLVVFEVQRDVSLSP